MIPTHEQQLQKKIQEIQDEVLVDVEKLLPECMYVEQQMPASKNLKKEKKQKPKHLKSTIHPSDYSFVHPYISILLLFTFIYRIQVPHFSWRCRSSTMPPKTMPKTLKQKNETDKKSYKKRRFIWELLL